MHSAADIDAGHDRTYQIGLIVAGAVVIALVIALFGETAATMVQTWYESNSFNHDFLIIPICGFLGWRVRAELAAADVRPAISGLLLVALATFGWLVGNASGTLVVQELCLVAVIQGVILTTYGWSVCRILAFPLLFLYFAVPFGQALVPPLQTVTAFLSVAILKAVGTPVFADGNVISVPSGTFYVAEACSGIRYLIASLVLGVLFAGITYRSWWRRAVFLAISLVVPVVANGIRAFGIIFLAYSSNNQIAVGVDHLIYGWFFFTLVTLVTLAIGRSFRDEEGGQAVVIPSWTLSLGSALYLLLAAALALSIPVAAKLYARRFDRPPAAVSVQLRTPQAGSNWQSAERAEDPAPPLFVGADTELHAAYVADGTKVYLHIGYYQYDRRGAQAVSSAHKMVHGSGWILAETKAATMMIEGEKVAVQMNRYTRGRRGHTTWSWYWVGGRMTGNAYLARLLEAKAKLFSGERAAAIIVLDVDYDESADGSEDALVKLAASLRGLSAGLASPSEWP